MAVNLERSEFETEFDVPPKPVASKKSFASFIAGKAVKGLIWTDSDDGIMIMFTDQSRVIIEARGTDKVQLRYVPGPPPKATWGLDSTWRKSW